MVTGTWSGGQVTGLVVSQGDFPHKITLTWNSFSNAAMYSVYAARTQGGYYEQVAWGVPGASMEIYLDEDYSYYYYRIGIGQKYWYRVQAIVSTAGGIAYSEMSDAVQGWSDPNIHDGSWVFQSESISSSGGSDTVTSGTRYELVIDATAKTIQYKDLQYDTGTQEYDTMEGAEFSYDHVLYPDKYSETIQFVDLRQTKYWSTAGTAFQTLSSSSYTEQTGGYLVGVRITIRIETGFAELMPASSVDFDSSDDGTQDSSISGSIGYLRALEI